MNVHIRPYRPSDIEPLLNSWETATRLAHEFMTDDFIAQERKNITEIYIPNTDTWVAELDGAVQGFISLMGNEVGALFLQPNYHGKKIGKRLMDKALELHEHLEVEVFKENPIGLKFYTRYGFVPSKEYLHKPTGQMILRLSYATNEKI